MVPKSPKSGAAVTIVSSIQRRALAFFVDADKQRRGNVLLTLPGRPVGDEESVSLHGAGCGVGPLHRTHIFDRLACRVFDNPCEALHAPA
jgi:hypothetical protein